MCISKNSILRRSDNVVFRKIQSDCVLVPIVSSSADVDSIFSLNETGSAVWDCIDGTKTLYELIEDIKSEYESQEGQIEDDIIAFVVEMAEAKLIEIS